jgi:hypothetical protein
MINVCGHRHVNPDVNNAECVHVNIISSVGDQA